MVALGLEPSSLPGALYPWFSGEGRGVVDCLLTAGLLEAPEIEGRVPMGATDPCPGLPPETAWRGGEPPGEEALVRLDC